MVSGSDEVRYVEPRSFWSKLKYHCKETLFPDDPFRTIRTSKKPLSRLKATLDYFVPIFEWLPNYNVRTDLKYDLLAGITITSLAIPQGISYAKLADIPPIIGLYSSFIPPLVYAVFGSSKHLAVGTVAASSLLIADSISSKVSAKENPTLYLNLVFTATFITGVFQTLLGVLRWWVDGRLGILVDFLPHSTITGFMGGTATIICLQQLKAIFGLTHFTTHTDVVHVLRAVFTNKNIKLIYISMTPFIILLWLIVTFMQRKRKPKLFWVSAIAPMSVVIIGCIFAYVLDTEKHGIQIVGDLKKGLNPISIYNLNFGSQYLPATIKAGLITGIIAMAEGIAIGRSFAIVKNQQTDGNKEMVAFGLMNIIGSFFSCYLTTGPFSKTAVNFNAGCRTAMSNIVMSICMMLTLVFLAPLFKYTPLVALAAIILSAMLGLIDYEEMYRLFKVDKFDFLICMTAFLGVTFLNMDNGLAMSVGLALLRALLYVARPSISTLGRIPNSAIYRDMEQYPEGTKIPGMLVLQLGSPIYYASSNYIRESLPVLFSLHFSEFFEA
ncbi:Probable sulfate transporter 3.5 [Linum perenne]